MGIYLNPDNIMFKDSVKKRIYVDKSMLIYKTNDAMDYGEPYICVSRPRRFGKSVDANMLVAYYSKGCDSHELFDDLKIAKCESYEKYLNQKNVIRINMQDFLEDHVNVSEMIEDVRDSLYEELKKEFNEIIYHKSLRRILNYIHQEYNESFIFIIDEWDCVFREYKEDKEQQEQYLKFLRGLFKDQPYIDLVYMTGILPIKKYGTHSALNMFREISMINASPYQKFMGFIKEEVVSLCEQYHLDYNTMKLWYDGYQVEDEEVYCPKSVVEAIERKKYFNYWSNTETYEALKIYIDMNIDGIKDDIIKMLSKERVDVDTISFKNDMVSIASKDDVYTLLIHLGYLTYDQNENKVWIPNKEVMSQFVTAIKNCNWKVVSKSLENSKKLLEATINMDCKQVANYIEQAHLETSILQYNDKNALAYTIYLAYYAARDYYTLVREYPSGKGFADLVFIPYRNNKAAMVVELKYDHDVDSGIKQIKAKKYFAGLEKYLDNLLLISISYDKDSKKHECMIEKYQG